MSPERWTATSLRDLKGTTFVVTGASSGLGAETARALACAGARVVLAVRDPAKGERIAAAIDGDTEVRLLDLADLASVRAFADTWTGPIDVLVNNAGIMAVPETRTVDGFESQIATNHLGHFALTLLLLGKIRDRVVTVTSVLAAQGSIDLDDLNWEHRRYKPWAAYSQSKLANQLFTFELQRRLVAADNGVRAIAAHPGVAATDLLQTGNRLIDLMLLPLRLAAPDAARGALPTLYAATQDLPGGTLIGPDAGIATRRTPQFHMPPPAAANAETARGLWDLSARLTGVDAAVGPA